jgi:hypothetical protein
MANFPADIQTTVDGPASGQPLVNRIKANRLNGRIRIFEALYRAPASGANPAIGDKIIWGKLPAKARVLGHLSKLYWTTGTASCTLNLGDQFSAARHLAATAITTAGGAVPEAAAITTTSVADVTINSLALTNVKSIGAYTLGAAISGTGVPAGAYVTAIDYNSKTVTMSAAATATNAAQTITVNGDSYETQDDTSNITNAYASATDDCTLISTVAGAQIANNQVLVLKVAYVTD